MILESSILVCSTAAIDSLSASTSSACDDVNICLLSAEQYLETTDEKEIANTLSAYDDNKICVLPVEQNLKTTKEDVSASISSVCNKNICTSPVKQYLKTAKENISLLSQDPKKVLL